MKNIKSLKFWVIVATVVIACALVLFCSQAKAQTWYTANQVTVSWNAPTLLSDGTPIPAADTIRYQVYIRTGTTGDGTPVGSEITALQNSITFSSEGAYFVGVKSKRYIAGETVAIGESSISWSNVSEVTDGSPFGIRYYVAPAGPSGLRRVP